MSTISGSVLYNINNQAPTTGIRIPNIPISLYNTTTHIGVVALTNASGLFTITNVPSGSYTLVESYGTSGLASPVDFSTSTLLNTITPADPIVSAIPGVSPIASYIQSLSPNTLFITVTTPDISSLNFIDGPVKNVPLTYSPYVTISQTNLVTAGANGTIGTLPAGTPINTRPASAPYPTATPGFIYTSYAPFDGHYMVSNTSTNYGLSPWYFTSDHTSHDETGRMMVINGSNPGAIIFQQTVNVLPNTAYLATTWILNMLFGTGYALPQLGITVRDLAGNQFFNRTSADIGIDSIPSWYQLGTIFNTGNNSSVKVEVYSNGPTANGNDFIVDDIFLNLINPTTILTMTKAVDSNYVALNDQLTYTFTLNNITATSVSNFIFIDSLPLGATFVNNSLIFNNSIINGSPLPPGVDLGTINPNSTNTISFKIIASTTPTSNYITNQSNSMYVYNATTSGVSITNTILTNTVSTFVATDNLALNKFVDKSYATCGETLTYTLTLTNNGNISANKCFFKDTLSNSVTFLPNSVFLNNSLVTGASPLVGFDLGSISPNSSVTITFQCLTNC